MLGRTVRKCQCQLATADFTYVSPSDQINEKAKFNERWGITKDWFEKKFSLIERKEAKPTNAMGTAFFVRFQLAMRYLVKENIICK